MTGVIHLCGPSGKAESFDPCGCPQWSYFDSMELSENRRKKWVLSKRCPKGHTYLDFDVELWKRS